MGLPLGMLRGFSRTWLGEQSELYPTVIAAIVGQCVNG